MVEPVRLVDIGLDGKIIVYLLVGLGKSRQRGQLGAYQVGDTLCDGGIVVATIYLHMAKIAVYGQCTCFSLVVGLGGERLEDKIFFATPHPEVGECQSTTNGIDRIALQVGL